MNIQTNYHTHTTRCHHASGEDREYVESAISNGYKILGFSDHTPYPLLSDFRSGMRMSVEDADGYFSSISALKKEYKDDITIYAGVEAEYFPEHFGRLIDFFKAYPIDYMIMGQHYVPDEEHGRYLGDDFTNKASLDLYVEYVTEGLKTGKFSYLAHPDLPRYFGENQEDTLKNAYTKICLCAKSLNIPLEINCLGYLKRPHSMYPSDMFFEVAKKVGNSVIIGVDAHSPKQLSDASSIDGCLAIAKNHCLHVVSTLDIHSVH